MPSTPGREFKRPFLCFWFRSLPFLLSAAHHSPFFYCCRFISSKRFRYRIRCLSFCCFTKAGVLERFFFFRFAQRGAPKRSTCASFDTKEDSTASFLYPLLSLAFFFSLTLSSLPLLPLFTPSWRSSTLFIIIIYFEPDRLLCDAHFLIVLPPFPSLYLSHTHKFIPSGADCGTSEFFSLHPLALPLFFSIFLISAAL